MKRLAMTTALIGTGLIAGGVGSLALSGYDVLNLELWEIAIPAAISQPGVIIDAAFNGGEKSLYSGILFVSAGGAIVVGTFGIILAYSAVGVLTSFVGSTGNLFNRSRGSTIKIDHVVDLDDDEVMGANPARKKWFNDALNSVGRTIKESELPLKMVTVLSQLKAKMKPDSNRIQISPVERALREAAVVKVDQKELREWHNSLQLGTRDSKEIISSAKKIVTHWSDEDFAVYAQRDFVNGAFVVALVKSWASRSDDEIIDVSGPLGEEAYERPDRQREAILAAVRAESIGESFAGINEVKVDLEDDDAIPGIADLYSEEPALSPVVVAPRQMENVGTDDVVIDPLSLDDDDVEMPGLGVGGAEDSEFSELDQVLSICGDMRDYHMTLLRVKAGEDEWYPGLSDEFERNQFVVGLTSKLTLATMSQDFSEELSSMAESGDELCQWIVENGILLDDAFAEMVSEVPVSDDDIGLGLVDMVSATGDAAHLPSYADEVDVSDVDSVAMEVVEAQVSSDPDQSVVEDDDEGYSSVANDILNSISSGGMIEEVDETSSELSVDGVGEVVDPFSDVSSGDESVPVELPEMQNVENGEAENDVHEVYAASEVDTEAQETGGDVAAISDDEPMPIIGNGLGFVSRDVGEDPLKEIELGGSIPYEWGNAGMACGATDAAIAKVVYSKENRTFKPLGVVHVLIIWKQADAVKRMNVVLKKLTPGKWSIIDSGGLGLRLENEAGEFVEVPESFLSHKDVDGGKTVIHLYGEGIEVAEREAVRHNLICVNGVLSGPDIRDFIGI